jgi:hypothetical protein
MHPSNKKGRNENDVFHVDREILNDNICIYLDDIVITGAHEHRIQKMLNKYNLFNDKTEHIFLYFAQLTNINEDPTIENYLNYSYVKNLNFAYNSEFFFSFKDNYELFDFDIFWQI